MGRWARASISQVLVAVMVVSFAVVDGREDREYNRMFFINPQVARFLSNPSLSSSSSLQSSRFSVNPVKSLITRVTSSGHGGFRHPLSYHVPTSFLPPLSFRPMPYHTRTSYRDAPRRPIF
ncbi:uncharacterized protein LOC143026161 [Oratosquilla oratoria]|uniref:uncharacterized protein LOC143026161 n=1 Tax=Oratosquilla oratoria TaxID=337810 RepID=UPI003F75B272